MKALLVSGGNTVSKELIDIYIKDRFIIAADSGIKTIKKYDLYCDLVIGDMDSQDESTRDYIIAKNIKNIKYPVKKDGTDTELCIKYLIENNFKDIVIISARGSRFDHEIANVFSLIRLYDLKIKAKIVDDNNEIYALGEGIYKFSKNDKKYISLVSITKGVIYSSKGLLYETNDLNIKREFPGHGVSNEIIDKTCEIEIEKGIALIIKSKD